MDVYREGEDGGCGRRMMGEKREKNYMGARVRAGNTKKQEM